MAKSNWLWERAAMRGEAMPDGLPLPDQMAYEAMRCLYGDYLAGRLTKDQAAHEKQEILARYSEMSEEIALDHIAGAMYKELVLYTTDARSAVMADPTPENALFLCDAISRTIEKVRREWGRAT